MTPRPMGVPAQSFDFGRGDARGLCVIIECLDGQDLETRLVHEGTSRPDAAAFKAGALDESP